MTKCRVCNSAKEASENYDGDACALLVSAYILAGLAMMLNIRLSYSSAPYALIRFRLPENLFSVFVRRMASALELWCLPSMLLGNIIDLLQKLVIYPKILQNEAGTNQDAGLREKAKNLHTKAKNLYDAVNNPGGDEKAAKVLQAKAGTDENTEGKLRKLAADLYKAAKELESVAGGNDSNAAQNLANEVGQDESNDTGKLRHALKELGNLLAGASGSELIQKANAVTSQYGTAGSGVKQKFGEVEKQKSTYESKGLQTQYQAVEKAWNAFNAVYNPEEQLMDAANSLQLALKDLAEAGVLPPHTKAEEVKNKFEGFGTVKSKFNLVKKQEKAYEQGGNIKDGKYTPVKTDFEAFNNAYRDAIYPTKFYSIIVPSIVTQWLNFATYVLLLVIYLMGGESGHLTLFYFVIAISGVVFGINMTLLYAVDFYYIPVYIVGENSFPIVTSFIHYLSTVMFGNRRKYNSDFLLVMIDIVVAILISLVAAVVWTYGYVCEGTPVRDMKHIHAFGFGGNLDWQQISPFMMIVVGMGLVYSIYPGIAPGMIVPFYLIDKIEMVLLIATIFPPVIIALLRKYKKEYSPQYNNFGTFMKWSQYGAGRFYLFLDILMVIKITLAAIFIYSLHYRDSNLSRSIINQPKMSTFLSITFYMCHEILLALGFSGFIGNDGGDYILIPQYIGALFMIFLAFYSEGYIIEYKSHDPALWPTEEMWYLYGYYQLNPNFLLYKV